MAYKFQKGNAKLAGTLEQVGGLKLTPVDTATADNVVAQLQDKDIPTGRLALANGTVVIGDGSGTAVSRSVTGDISISATGTTAIGAQKVLNSMLADAAVGADELAADAVVNASVASGAAIAFSKINTAVDMGGAYTIGDSNDVCTIGGDLTVTGDLIVSGDTVTVNTATLTVEDPLIALGSGNGADSVDLGFYAKYVDSGTKYAGLFRDASDSDKWKLFARTGNSDEVPSTTVNTSSGFVAGTLVATLEGSSTSCTGLAASATVLATGRTIGGTSFNGSANIAVALAATATALATGRTIGGTSFDGTANIAVGLAATATVLATARDIGGVSFNGSAAITLPGVNSGGNQATSGRAATAGVAETATILATARNIGGVSFNGSAAITLPGVNSGGNQDTSGTAAVATQLTVSDAESTAAEHALCFTATLVGGVSAIKSDGDVTYNPGLNGGTLTCPKFAGALTGNVTGLASTATLAALATTVTITDAESTAAEHALVFTSDLDGGNVGLKSDGDVTYNPGLNGGTLTCPKFAGVASSADILAASRNIGGVAFNGSANINLPGVNLNGTVDTSGNAATATVLQNARTIGGVSFSGAQNITPQTIDIATENVDSDQSVLFAGGASGAQRPKTDPGIVYNPSTNKLTAGFFVGDGSLLTSLPAGTSAINFTVSDTLSFQKMKSVPKVIAADGQSEPSWDSQAYTIDADGDLDYYLFSSSHANNDQINLTAKSGQNGRLLIIKNGHASNVLRVDANSSETIEGHNGAIDIEAGASITLMCIETIGWLIH